MPIKPGNLRPLKRRRISFTQGTSVRLRAEDPEKRLISVTRLVVLSVCRNKQSAEAHKQRKVEPPILPSPRMAEDAAEVRNLRRAQPEGPPTEKRRRIGNRASQGTSRTAELRNPDASELRNLRHMKCRRIRDRAEDPSLRPAETLDRGHAWGL